MKLRLEIRVTIYCHGLPGSAAEILNLGAADNPTVRTLGSLDLARFETLISQDPECKYHLIGFSLGCMTALRMAALHPNKFEKITLIAPAAPLELGNFLPKMAGQAVFKTARHGEFLFGLFTNFQRLGAVILPNQVVSAMFAGSPKADIDLLSDATFKQSVITGLRFSLGKHRKQYCKAILAYVQPWAHHLKDVKSPVAIHHGTADNWAPVEMAYALQKEIKSIIY